MTAAFAAGKLAARERYSLPDEQVARIEQRLDVLVEATRTMGRKDWITLVGNIGFSRSTAWSLRRSCTRYVAAAFFAD